MKKEKKANKKTLTDKVKETKVVTTPEETVVETATESTTETKVEDPAPQPKKKTEKQKKEMPIKNEEPLIPEVLDKNEEKEFATPAPSLGSVLNSNNGDRIDNNHAIDLMGMIHKEYVNNPSADPKKAIIAKKQFDVMAAIQLTAYFTQLESDFQQLGVKITPDMRQQAEEVLGGYLGIKTKYTSTEDGQLLLEFQEVPADLKAAIKSEQKLEKKKEPIPEPDINMAEPQKLETLKRIFMARGAGGIGCNLINGIAWARKAFGFEESEKPAVIIANLLSKNMDSVMFRCYTGMAMGKLTTDHSILGAHALLKRQCPNMEESTIAELMQVFVTAAAEKRANDNSKNLNREINIDNELTLISNNIARGNSSEVINGIVENKEKVVIKADEKVLLDTAVDTSAIKKLLTIAYGDSNNIIKDKVNEIIKYYTKPIARLSKYVDKSAYTEA